MDNTATHCETCNRDFKNALGLRMHTLRKHNTKARKSWSRAHLARSQALQDQIRSMRKAGATYREIGKRLKVPAYSVAKALKSAETGTEVVSGQGPTLEYGIANLIVRRDALSEVIEILQGVR